jgi:ribosomal protein S18 acetylase RimI-like enzyme
VSEFYAQRRTTIKDAVGLIAFILGWFAAGPYAWHYISEGFDTGSPAGGVLRFLGIVFVVGVITGGGGLLLGGAVGAVWERVHRRTRHVTIDEPVVAPAKGPEARAEQAALLSTIRFSLEGMDPAEFHELALGLGYQERERERVVRGMERSINIGAWDGDRLVGAARVLTDGFLAAALVDIFVAAGHQRRGIGRTLMNHAFNATPRGTLLIVAGNNSSAFFHAVGCERTMAGYIMRKNARR